MERWSLELRAFDFHIVHRPGSKNQHADALSRRPIALVAFSPPLEAAEIAEAQRADPVLSAVIEQVEKKTSPPSSGEWLKFSLKQYRQLWSQLTIHQSILCQKVKSPTMTDTHLLVVVPCSLQKLFLELAHDNSGHQGADCTVSKLSDIAYWIGMGRRVADHCKFCVKCQMCRAPAPKMCLRFLPLPILVSGSRLLFKMAIFHTDARPNSGENCKNPKR